MKTGVVEPELLAAKRDLGPLAAADPVALHRLDVLGPLDLVEIVEQAVGVLGDAKEPLLELADLDLVAAALAAAVDHLLVGEHGLVVRAPVDRRLLAVGEPALEQAQEDPLRPAVIAGLVGGQLARPVDRDAPRAEGALKGGDRLVGRLPGMDTGPDRVVLGGQPERVVAHRVQHAPAGAAVEVGDRVAQRVVLEMADVGLAARVREHFEHIGLVALVVSPAGQARGRWRPPTCLPPPRRSATGARSPGGCNGRADMVNASEVTCAARCRHETAARNGSCSAGRWG